MALQLGALRDALDQAGVSKEAARAAAEEVASFEGRLSKIDARLLLLTWMVGLNAAATVGGFGTLITIALKFLPVSHP